MGPTFLLPCLRFPALGIRGTVTSLLGFLRDSQGSGRLWIVLSSSAFSLAWLRLAEKVGLDNLSIREFGMAIKIAHPCLRLCICWVYRSSDGTSGDRIWQGRMERSKVSSTWLLGSSTSIVAWPSARSAVLCSQTSLSQGTFQKGCVVPAVKDKAAGCPTAGRRRSGWGLRPPSPLPLRQSEMSLPRKQRQLCEGDDFHSETLSFCLLR